MKSEKSIVSKQLIEIFENVLRIENESIVSEYGKKMSMTEIHTIAAIGMEELASMSEIASKLHITVGTLTVAVNNLVKKGFAERYKSEQDRRVVKIGLTKQGRKIFLMHEEFHRCLAAALMKNLETEQREAVVQALENLTEFIEQGYSKFDTIQK